MKKPFALAGAAVAAVALLAGAAYAQQPQQQADQAKPDLTIAQIRPGLESQGYTAIESIEKDDGVWEVEATSPKGVRVELHLDPKDGRVLREERDTDDDD